jgi:hypothetical protein
MEITKETSPTTELRHGHIVVGTTRVRLSNSFKLARGVMIRAAGGGELDLEDEGNTVAVWVGGPAVTADYGPTGGVPIMPGSGMFLPVDDPSQLWLIAAADNQDISWMGT